MDTNRRAWNKYLILLALPREAHEVGNINGLAQGLGGNAPTELQRVSVAQPKPPLPDKRRPASAGTEPRAQEKESNFERPKNSKGRTRARAIVRRSFTVSVGRESIGRIEQTDDRCFTARIAPNGVELGVFGTLKAAADAISDAHGGSNAR